MTATRPCTSITDRETPTAVWAREQVLKNHRIVIILVSKLSLATPWVARQRQASADLIFPGFVLHVIDRIQRIGMSLRLVNRLPLA